MCVDKARVFLIKSKYRLIGNRFSASVCTRINYLIITFAKQILFRKLLFAVCGTHANYSNETDQSGIEQCPKRSSHFYLHWLFACSTVSLAGPLAVKKS